MTCADCQIVNATYAPGSGEIEFCPLHAQAGAMLDIIAELSCCLDDTDGGVSFPSRPLIARARAILREVQP